MNAQVLRDVNGNITGTQGVARDITERKEAENELVKAKEKAEEQESRIKGILDNLQDAFFQADLNGCFTYVNPTATKMYGYSYDELIGKKAEMLYAEPHAREKIIADLREFEKVTDWNTLGLRKDGSSFWVSMNVQFVKDNFGKIIGTEDVVRDISERKQAEIALRESEVKFQQMFDISPVGIVFVGLDKRFIRCNLAFSQSLGYDTEELVGKLITDITFSEDIHIGMTEMMSILKGEIAQSQVQKRYLRKDGQIIWGETTISLLRDSEGCAQYFLAIIQDITERKRAEKALVDNERKYRTLFETADDAILLFAGDQWVDCNTAASRVFGCTREQIIGAHPRIFSPPTQPDGRSSEELSVERIKLSFSKKPQSFEWVHCRADGTLFDAEVHLNQVDLEDKPFIQAIVRDVSERKQAEQDRIQAEDKVRESEELFRTAFESSVAGISMVRPDGNFIRVNNKFCEIVGYKKEELFCLKFNDITYEKDKEVASQYHKQMVAGELESATVEKRYIKKNGNVIWVLLSIAAIRNKQKELQFFVTYTQDITEQKEILEKLRLMVDSTIRTIALIVEARDPYTSGHQIRVADISVAIAKELNLTDEQIQGIYYACLIHDLGKIQVPAEILSMPRKLTKLEFELIKTHPLVGYELIKDIDFPWPIAEMIYQHHERMDGSGYPRNLKRNRISIGAKIMGVADVIEAMSSHRPYRPALGLEAALDEINKNKGTLYDPDVVEAFNKVIKKDKTLLSSA
jgi:PAS domain S-box-containing protein